MPGEGSNLALCKGDSMFYVLGYVGTRPKLLGFSRNPDEANVKRIEASRDGYGGVQLVDRGVIDYLQRYGRLIPNTN